MIVFVNVNSIKIMSDKENEPRFIVGLKMAKNLLVELRKGKVKEMQIEERVDSGNRGEDEIEESKEKE